MPDIIRDFPPPPPWEGFPVPDFLWEGVKHMKLPLELELDSRRGVLYLHNLQYSAKASATVLRICRIPEKTISDILAGVSADLNLSSVVPGRGLEGARAYKRSPVFTSINEGSFTIETEAGEIILEVEAVPVLVLDSLREYQFTDITVGVTK